MNSSPDYLAAMPSASATPASEPVVKKGKFPFGLDCFMWTFQQFMTGLSIEIDNSRNKGAGVFLGMGNNAAVSFRALMTDKYRHYVDTSLVTVSVRFSKTLAPDIAIILNATPDLSKVRKLDEQVLTSYFGPELMTYLRMQSDIPPLALLESKTRECLTIYGLILPPGFEWAEEKKTVRAKKLATVTSTTT